MSKTEKLIKDNIGEFKYDLKKESESLLVNKYPEFVNNFLTDLKSDNKGDRFLFYPPEYKKFGVLVKIQ